MSEGREKPSMSLMTKFITARVLSVRERPEVKGAEGQRRAAPLTAGWQIETGWEGGGGLEADYRSQLRFSSASETRELISCLGAVRARIARRPITLR